jgi:hypothetical protein
MVIGQPMAIEFGKKKFISSHIYGACNRESWMFKHLAGDLPSPLYYGARAGGITPETPRV